MTIDVRDLRAIREFIKLEMSRNGEITESWVTVTLYKFATNDYWEMSLSQMSLDPKDWQQGVAGDSMAPVIVEIAITDPAHRSEMRSKLNPRKPRNPA